MAVKSVSEEPQVKLISWGVVVDGWSEPRLVGTPLGTTRGRISSAVQYFNLDTMTAVTASGRTYRLIGPADYFSAVAIVIAMRGMSEHIKAWMTVEDLALAVAPPSRGMN
ncbi:hypothetical protein GGQ99_005109 [Aminobacter niigataensis]|uniref:Uncharacterized protein n=1 Tax=Aminobacter niigataensis TaxID=83265 RepID=A0ABR6L932_9HYPH|nr:hypothetical protein [Aminobacter niigataensis]MBB4653319.1 hypothetical protein [Aminobacter niigataensis]